jgi:hypothetical protein
MTLKDNLKESFKKNIDNNPSLEESTLNLINAYKKSVESSFDSLGNSLTGINFNLIYTAFLKTFKLCLDNNIKFNFSLISPAMTIAWSTARLKLPAKVPPGFSLVSSNLILSSISIPVPINLEKEDDFLNSLETFFKDHAKTLVNNYIGTSSSVPPTPIALPVKGFNLK